MSVSFNKFKDLHYSDRLFVLPNVWNPKSATLFQEKGFSAVGTSSAAVANCLGYEDGEQMPFDDYLFIIKRIQALVNIPLTVDMEMGYGPTAENIYANIQKLLELGVAGINIEDSSVNASGRALKDPKAFAKTIESIKTKLAANKEELFINVRCDTFILNVPDKKEETVNRLKIYEAAGADGIFLPCISEEEDIAEAVSTTKLPLNVMCIPTLPGFDTLNKLGVKRVSMGPFLFNKAYDNAAKLAQAVMDSKDFSPLFS